MGMASVSATPPLFLITLLLSLSSSVVVAILSATVVEDLNRLLPPPDFNTTIASNCKHSPSLRYCNFTPTDLPEIFKFTIVASHLCNESKNPNCVESFPKIDLRSRPKIAPLYLSFAFFWKYCPLTVLSIDLANNSLKGNFPSDIFHCSQIQSLDLSRNDLSGEFPVHNFSLLTDLTFLNLSYNHFSESKISDTQFFKRFNSSSFLHSGLVPDHVKFTIKALILLIGFPVSVIMVVAYLCWLCFWRPDFLPGALRIRKHEFTPSMLKGATEGFSKKNLVAKNTEGLHIYRGLLRDGREVQIDASFGDHHISRHFVEQCETLVGLRHKNLVRVLGWCENRKLRAIVAEWRDSENVEMWLTSASAPPWKHRVKVLTRIMDGMRYLHEEWPQVGYDLKTSSIFLSQDWTPLISRFRVEDANNCTKKVYKFGVLLLEMVANRRPREEFQGGEAGFVEWIRLNYPRKVSNVIDGRMKITTGHTLDQATQAIGLGLKCTDLSSRRGQQPSLDQIFDMATVVLHNSILGSASSSPTCNVLLHGDRRTTGHRRNQSR